MITQKLANPDGLAGKRILLVEDHAIFRHGIEAFLRKYQPMCICTHADGPSLALESIRDYPPDLAIVDVSLAGADGVELIKRMKAEMPRLVILVLTMHDEPVCVLRAFKAGAQGYVIKMDPPRDLLEAITSVVAGKIFLSARLRPNPIFKVLYETESLTEQLTDREVEVLLLVARGRSTAAIAKELGLSVKTVETYQAHIKQKLGLSNFREMTEFATNLVSYQGEL